MAPRLLLQVIREALPALPLSRSKLHERVKGSLLDKSVLVGHELDQAAHRLLGVVAA